MAELTALSFEDARTLGARFGLEVGTVEPLPLGSVNSNFRFKTSDGRAFFARIYEEQPRQGAEDEIRLLSTLDAAGVPVAPPLVAAGGERVLEHQGKPFTIFPWVAGEWLCLSRVTEERCRALGRALARVHLASPLVKALPEGRFRPVDMLERLARVEREQPLRVPVELRTVREKYAQYLPLRDDALPRGICHGDLFRDNVLWQGERLAALLDFESAANGSFAYDLMVTTLAWCFRDDLVVEQARALYEGYSELRPLSAAERASLPVEGVLGCLRFATSRITDFELRTAAGARPARDFRRFLRRIEAIERGAFSEVWAPAAP
jgi:homoserine kinase type II